MFANIFVFIKPGKRPSMQRMRKNESKEEWMQFTKGIWELPPDRDLYHPATFPLEHVHRRSL